MAACVEASLLDGSRSSCPPLHHGLISLSPTASKAPAMVYMAGHSHSSLFCCSGSLKNHPQGMSRLKGEAYKRTGAVVFAGKGGGEAFPSVEKDGGTGLLSVDRTRSSKDVNGVLDYSAKELIRDVTRSPSEETLYRNFVDELVERMEMVLRNDDGTSAEDYKRRADFFTRINEIFVAQKNSEDRAVESDANPSSAAVVAKSPSKSADRNTEITVSGGKSVVDEMEEEVLTLEDLLMEHDDGTGAADYNRRAAIFGWSAEMVTARTQHSQRSINSLQLEERKFEDVLVLEEDNGRAASDYSRRAAIFGKNAELLVAASHKRAEKKRLGCL